MHKKETEYTKKRQGMYDVHMITKQPNSTQLTPHSVLIPDADSKKDAFNKASKEINPNLEIVKVIIVFLGILVLLAVVLPAVLNGGF